MQTMHGNRRRNRRHRVHWNGECRVGEGYALGCFRDISKRGAFFQPVTELLGIPREGAGEIPLLLRPGDAVFVTYELLPSGREVTAPATVRWVGTSEDHDTFGAGLELHGKRYKC